MQHRSIAVYIGGQRYIVRSDAEEDYIQKLADYVNERIQEVQRSLKPIPPQSLAVLASLNIADDLFKERRRREELKQKIREKSDIVLAYLDKETKKFRHK